YEHTGGVRFYFFFSSRRRHTRSKRDWSSDVCSSDLVITRPTTRLTSGPAMAITATSPAVCSPPCETANAYSWLGYPNAAPTTQWPISWTSTVIAEPSSIAARLARMAARRVTGSTAEGSVRTTV